MKSDLSAKLFLAAVLSLLAYREFRPSKPVEPTPIADTIPKRLDALESAVVDLRAVVAALVGPVPAPPKPAPVPPEGDIEVAARAFAHWPVPAMRSVAAKLRAGDLSNVTYSAALQSLHDKAAEPLARALLSNPGGLADGLDRAASAYQKEMK